MKATSTDVTLPYYYYYALKDREDPARPVNFRLEDRYDITGPSIRRQLCAY